MTDIQNLGFRARAYIAASSKLEMDKRHFLPINPAARFDEIFPSHIFSHMFIMRVTRPVKNKIHKTRQTYLNDRCFPFLQIVHMMDDWDLPDSVFLTGGRRGDFSSSDSFSPAVVCVVVG